MVLNYIWVCFFIIAFIVALIRVTGYCFRDFFAERLGVVFDQTDLKVFSDIVDSTFSMAELSVTVSIYLIGVMTLWLGIMKIGEQGGAVNALSRLFNPFFRKLFPEIPKDHPATGSIMMNFCANMLGLDNAATPMGLKAMEQLQEINPTKDTASNAQIMFLVLNASGLTIIPVSILAMRAANGAANPTDVFFPILIATYCSTLVALIGVSIRQKINLLNRIILAYVGGITLLIAGIIFYLSRLPQEKIASVTGLGANFVLFGLIIGFIILGLRKKINIYESFIDGAKEGFSVAIKIIPYLVAMLLAIGVFRASGGFDFIVHGIGNFFALFGMNTDFVDALPTAIMKPLSGSGARGMMVETMKTFGADSFAGRLSCVFQGTTETTFFIVAVYFGAVNIKKTRYTITYALIGDLAGIIASIYIAYMFFH